VLSVSLGPLSVSITQLLLLAALLVAAGVGYLVGRRRKNGISLILGDMLIVGMVTARIAFVAQWFDIYRKSPWSMLDIRDGGFTPWAGAVAALLVAVWHGWRHAPLRKPLVVGLAAGALAWGAMFAALRMLQSPPLPAVALTTLAGTPTDLAALAAGEPVVVNLWASWCPPCRREMPVLAAAQQRETGVRFVFANQGEDGATVQRYLLASRLDLANVLLDPDARIGREVGSTGLPTTLFYDARGQLVDTNLGALSPATLADKLKRLRANTDTSTKE